jgi:hypothetical protein
MQALTRWYTETCNGAFKCPLANVCTRCDCMNTHTHTHTHTHIVCARAHARDIKKEADVRTLSLPRSISRSLLFSSRMRRNAFLGLIMRANA